MEGYMCAKNGQTAKPTQAEQSPPHPWVPSASPAPAIPHTESIFHAQHFVFQGIANQFADITGRV